MYAIVETGGKQYRVATGDVLEVERLAGDVGAAVTLEKVLWVSGETGTKIGTPHIANATVTGEVVGHDRTRKVIVFKKKKRKAYRRTKGHRQSVTKLKIMGISEG
jgi:large subunit ribosomal protein L21